MADDFASRSEDAALLKLLVDNVRDYAIFVLDPGGHVATWNSGAARIKGYAPREIIGQHFSVFYPAEEKFRCAYELEVATREGRFEDEGFRVRKDGSQFWANVVITPLRDAGGALVGFAKVTRDLTDRILREQQQLQLARAEEAQRRRDEFLAIMGHELRNPLAPMVTALHLIQKRGAAGNERELAVLVRQVAQMQRLVDDLLDASRLLRGKLQLERKMVEIADLVATGVEVARPLMERKKQQLVVEVGVRGLLVSADAVRMAQVFGNLLANAAKFTGEGGHVRVSVRPEAKVFAVTVEDDGVGMAPEVIPRIFELFAQGDQGVDRKQGGLGVGLAVARRIVEGHGGELLAESDGVGRGSRFTVRIPRARTALADVSSTTPGLGFALPRRVLLVHLDAELAATVVGALGSRGHLVATAASGSDALEKARAQRPNVVFIGTDGGDDDALATAHRLRQIPGCADVPLVAIGERAAEWHEERADAGFSAHVPAPVRPERVIRVVESAALG